MRDGLPNSGRYSRPQVSQNGREVVAEQSREESGGQMARPGSNASTVNAMRGEERDTRAKEYQQEVRSGRHGMKDRSRSRSPPRYENKRKSHGSKYEETDADGVHEHRRYSREASYNNDERSKRKEKKRSRDTENDYRAKKRSRSTTPDGSSSRHRHSRRDDKERSHRDHSRERRKTGHKYGGQDLPEEDEYHQRQKVQSARPSRHDRNGNVERVDREEAAMHTRPAVLEHHSDDIGFRIKGSKSREMRSSANSDMAPPTGPSAHHRDPYAAERERMKEQRLQRDAQRRQSVQSSGKRGRGEDEGDDDRNDLDDHQHHHHHHHHGRKKRSRPRAKYEDEIENHEHERESRRWR